jgi:hypothetical protein
MIINSGCEKCLFSDKASSEEPCKFNIINHIANSKSLKVIDDYYYIENYQCQYCLSKDFYLKNKEEFEGVDIMEQIKQKAYLKYYLIIDCDKSVDTKQLINKILDLGVSPKFVSFIVRDEDSVSGLVRELTKTETPFVWKVHAIAVQDMSFDDALKSVLDTNIKTCKSNYIWIRSYDQMIEDNKEIETINYLVNIKQDSVSILCSSASDTIHSCFLNTKDYEDLVTNVSTCLFKAISIVVKDKNLEIGYYD